MAGKKWNQLDPMLPTLARILAHADAATGLAKRMTIKQLLDLIVDNLGGSNSGIGGSSIAGRTLDCENNAYQFFEIVTPFDAPDSLILDNSATTFKIEGAFTVSEFAGLVTFPDGFISNDPRFDNTLGVFAAIELGLYTFDAWTVDHVTWYLRISQSALIIAS